MAEVIKASSSKRFLILLAFLIVTILTIFLGVPGLSQVLGFVFFTIIPGLLILYILRLNNLGLTEKLVLTVGLSISFLMLAGLFINTVLPLLGYDQPLTIKPLMLSLGIILLILTIVAYFRNRTTAFSKLFDFRLDAKEKAYLILPACFPALTVLGMHIMNTTSNNVMLMTLLFIIPGYVIFIAVKHRQIPQRIYPIIILLTSISLVLFLGLRSNHIIGYDLHTEYYFFQQTLIHGRWQILANSPLNACLSISILPSIYQSFLKINPEYLFKVLYPLIFSISPLLVYLISRKYIGGFYATLTAFFFMSQNYFLAAASGPRTIVAILFFGLAIMVLFHDRIGEVNKRVLFILFAISSITSHYSTTYIFLFVLLLTWIGWQTIPRFWASREKPSPPLNQPTGASPLNPTGQNSSLEATHSRQGSHVTIGIVVLFFIILFLWYSQITEVAFSFGINFIANTLKSLAQFFILESRGGAVVALAGSGLGIKGIPQHIEFVFSWLIIGFIIVGIVSASVRYRHLIALPEGEKGNPLPFLSRRLDAEFFILSLACTVILVTAVALPYILIAYGMARVWCQMMIVLSPLAIIGGVVLAQALHTQRAYLVILSVLIPFFMCQTGTMYQLFNVPRAITLNSEGQTYDILFIHDQEILAAKWIASHADKENAIYSDWYGVDRLISQGGIRSRVYFAEAFIKGSKYLEPGYFYLRYTGVVDGKLLDNYYQWHDMTDYQDEFVERNLIYSNGGSQVYK